MQYVTDTAEARSDASTATTSAMALALVALRATIDDADRADDFAAPVAADDVRRAIRNALFA